MEPCLAFDPILGLEHCLWSLADFRHHVDLIHGAGLETPACHVFAKDLSARVPTLLAVASTYGIKAYVVQPPSDLTSASMAQAAASIRTLSKPLKEAGVSLMLHNHRPDIETKINGRSAYEVLLDLCLGDLLGEVDVGWVYACERPPGIPNTEQGAAGDCLFEGLCPIGRGSMEIAAGVSFARANVLEVISDQDSYTPEMASELEGAVAVVCGL